MRAVADFAAASVFLLEIKLNSRKERKVARLVVYFDVENALCNRIG